MSTMIKKKGALAFKPKAPGSRRPGAPASASSSARPSIERQSQTPIPPPRPVTASAPSLIIPATQASPEIPLLGTLASAQAVDPVPPNHEHEPVPSRSTLSPEQDAATEYTTSSTPHTLTSPTSIARTRSSRPDNTDESSLPSNRHTLPQSPDLAHETTSVPEPLQPAVNSATISATAISSRSALPSSAPSQDAPVLDPVVFGASADLSSMGPGESLDANQRVPIASLSADGTSGESLIPLPAQKARRAPKRRRINPPEGSSEDVRETIEGETAARKRAPRKPQEPKEKKERRARAGTPSDAEDQAIDWQKITMAELTKDLGIGRKFSKHDEIRKREAEQKAKAKLARDFPESAAASGREGSQAGGSAVQTDQQGGSSGQNGGLDGFNAGVPYRIVDGQIVLNESMLQVDAHQEALEELANMVEVEENDFSRVTTSGTFMRREANKSWTFDEEQRFYEALGMFGTDFEIISKMFPNRNRRQVKLKFNKEERAFPAKINRALMGIKPEIDMEMYKEVTGLKFESVEEINAEHDRIEAEHNREQAEVQTRHEATVRQKKADIRSGATSTRATGTASSAPVIGTDSAKENEPRAGGFGGSNADDGKASAASKSKRKAPAKRQKKNMHSASNRAEEVEILGRID